MYIYIQCSRCGKRRRISTKSEKFIANAVRQGWGNYGRALYCPECSNFWFVRNTQAMGSKTDTFRLIAMVICQQVIDCTKRGKKK